MELKNSIEQYSKLDELRDETTWERKEYLKKMTGAQKKYDGERPAVTLMCRVKSQRALSMRKVRKQSVFDRLVHPLHIGLLGWLLLSALLSVGFHRRFLLILLRGLALLPTPILCGRPCRLQRPLPLQQMLNDFLHCAPPPLCQLWQ